MSVDYHSRQMAVKRMKALLDEHPYGSRSFKDKLPEYEALKNLVFGHLETKETETANDPRLMG